MPTRPFKLLWQTDYFEVIFIFIINRETNLKCRQPLPETGELGDDEEQLSQVKSMSLSLSVHLPGSHQCIYQAVIKLNIVAFNNNIVSKLLDHVTI